CICLGGSERLADDARAALLDLGDHLGGYATAFDIRTMHDWDNRLARLSFLDDRVHATAHLGFDLLESLGIARQRCAQRFFCFAHEFWQVFDFEFHEILLLLELALAARAQPRCRDAESTKAQNYRVMQNGQLLIQFGQDQLAATRRRNEASV